MWSRRGLSPIGIDLGRHAIKAVQCAGGRYHPRIAASLTLSRTGQGAVPDAEEARRLGDVLWRHGFEGRRAVVGVPEACLLCSVVEVPPAGAGAPVAQIAAGELARLHGIEGEGLETGCWTLAPAGPKSQRHEAVAVGVKTSDAMALVEVLQSRDGAGLDVLAADVGPCARARAALLNPPDEPAWAILDLGWGAARLEVVQDGTLVYERALQDAGLAHLELRLERECAMLHEDVRSVLGRVRGGTTRRVSSSWLGVVGSFAAQLAAEVSESLRYVALHRATPPARSIRLVGGGAECAPLVERLHDEIGGAAPWSLAGGAGQADPGGEPSGHESATGAALAGALGLSLWAA